MTIPSAGRLIDDGHGCRSHPAERKVRSRSRFRQRSRSVSAASAATPAILDATSLHNLSLVSHLLVPWRMTVIKAHRRSFCVWRKGQACPGHGPAPVFRIRVEGFGRRSTSSTGIGNETMENLRSIAAIRSVRPKIPASRARVEVADIAWRYARWSIASQMSPSLPGRRPESRWSASAAPALFVGLRLTILAGHCGHACKTNSRP